MLDSPYVEIKALSFTLGGRTIFDNINLQIPKGKITAIMGPSGTGKTTLLRLIGAQLRPDSGSVFVNGENIHKLSADALMDARRNMGMLFQNAALFSNLSVFENVAFPIREHTNLPEEIIKNIILMKLQAVGLRGARSLMPSELSGGMARRVALARAVALDPALVMYDEPFVGQDPITLGVLLKLIKTLNESLGSTSIIVSHDVAETTSIADYLYVLAEGRVVAQGEPNAVLAQKHPYVEQFMKGLPDGAVPFHYPAEDIKEDFLC